VKTPRRALKNEKLRNLVRKKGEEKGNLRSRLKAKKKNKRLALIGRGKKRRKGPNRAALKGKGGEVLRVSSGRKRKQTSLGHARRLRERGSVLAPKPGTRRKKEEKKKGGGCRERSPGFRRTATALLSCRWEEGKRGKKKRKGVRIAVEGGKRVNGSTRRINNQGPERRGDRLVRAPEKSPVGVRLFTAYSGERGTTWRLGGKKAKTRAITRRNGADQGKGGLYCNRREEENRTELKIYQKKNVNGGRRL